MSNSLTFGRAAVRKRGLGRVYLAEDISVETLAQVLSEPGEPIKSSRKSVVRRVGPYLVKESRSGWGIGLIRHTFQRNRYRRGWVAAHFLGQHNVGAPRPVAYIERGTAGFISGNVTVLEYLDGCRSVEHFLQAIIKRGAGRDTIMGFLNALARAVNRLTESGAYHEDLSGKNIYTQDGLNFYFIDLDAVETAGEYTDEMRLKNHIQLYDSFCDLLSDTLLVPFLEQMLPKHLDPRVWMPQVRKGQRDRRHRYEEKKAEA